MSRTAEGQATVYAISALALLEAGREDAAFEALLRMCDVINADYWERQ